MRRRGWSILCLLAVSACSASPRLPPDADIARAVPKPGVTAPAAQGETELAIRTFTTDGSEITGVHCTADSSLFTAAITAPGRVLMPYYGANSPVVSVECRANSATGRTDVAVNESWRGGIGGWPAVGVSVGTGDSGGVGVGMGWYGGGGGYGQPVYRYPLARVVMR